MIKIWIIFLTLLIGIVLGASGTYFVPDLIRPYLPELIQGKSAVLEGTVVSKEHKQATLLLTINTDQGALLATFKRKVPQIDLLVNTGDRIEFTLRSYKPFIQDPFIKKVKKEKPQPMTGTGESSIVSPPSEGDVPLPSQPEVQ
jgi:hypothetical protein